MYEERLIPATSGVAVEDIDRTDPLPLPNTPPAQPISTDPYTLRPLGPKIYVHLLHLSDETPENHYAAYLAVCRERMRVVVYLYHRVLVLHLVDWSGMRH